MKRAVILVGAVFGVALAVMIGSRMSADAMGVVVGVVCGVVAEPAGDGPQLPAGGGGESWAGLWGEWVRAADGVAELAGARGTA
jgi:hypothetical protein